MSEVGTKTAKKAPKTTLQDQTVGSKDGNQTLVAKKDGGKVQLWQGKIGFGVVRIKNNHYEVVLPCRIPEATARSVYEQTN